jgi:HSP20 family molecular chaperone IbpA
MSKEKTGLQKANPRETTALAESTRPGPTLTPPVDIYETEQRITLLADMPGVRKDDLKIDLREGVLTLSGSVAPPEGAREVEVLREYAWGTYFRQFTLSDVIDQGHIEATLIHGVLRLDLPKAERAKPRQITVHSA